MEPEYREGQILKCRRITDDFLTNSIEQRKKYLEEVILPDKTYVVEIREKGLVLKNIEFFKERNILNLISLNTDFPIETIDVEDIFAIWKIIQKITIENEE